MIKRMSRLGLLLATATAILSLSTSAAQLPETASTLLSEQALVREKAETVLSEPTRAFLSEQDSETARVWVYFTDKGVNSKEQVQAAAASVSLSEKVLKRRAKVGRDEVLFVDLPVKVDYVDQVAGIGAEHRRSSRWLNAASFDVPSERLSDIAALPFVASIRPVATFTRPNPEISQLRMDPEQQALSPDALDYGYALDQLNQINVPPVHEKGFDGSGVTLAILDTGFRKSHEVFAQHYVDGRVLDEYDFVFNDGNTANEPIDWGTQWNHGTLIWSVSGGYMPGKIIGPAYNANFLLAKTEDIRSETQVEEDNWLAAVEWADSLGADVITSSLGYSDWYTYSDFDGNTAVTTVAANLATALGIVVCNSMGNGGPGSGTLTAPADAFEILAVGAVDQNGSIASFSSRGPTYDGRMKPEVVARGVATQSASASANNAYTTANGTSLSTPLVAGAAVLLVQARPTFTPQMIRQAFMETADRSTNPDNTFGWGLIDTDAALTWGVNFTADVTQAYAPQMVSFSDASSLTPTSWEWDFGDGTTSTDQNPSHIYEEAGAYTVSLTIETSEYGPLSSAKQHYIILLGDTLSYGPDSVYAGEDVSFAINLSNSQPLEVLRIPIQFEKPPWLFFDSVSFGRRTAYFEHMQQVSAVPSQNKYVYELTADYGGGSAPLEPGTGDVMRIHFSTDPYAWGGQSAAIDSLNGTYPASLSADYLTYNPEVHEGHIALREVLRGDANNDSTVNIADLTYMVGHLYLGEDPPITIQSGDANADFLINVSDVTFLVDYLFRGGNPPQNP